MCYITICDDVFEERRKLRRFLKDGLGASGMEAEIMEYDSGVSLLSDWKRDGIPMDMLFLDIYMKGPDGVETARRLREEDCRADIIFLTVSPDFAIEGYEVGAAGYLLKPLEKEKLKHLLGRLLQRQNPAMLSLRQGNSVYSIVPSEILYIESSRNKLTVHTVREKISCYGRLDDLAVRLPEKQFLRCHQSFLVNMDRIYSAKDDFRMENDAIVPIRVRERKAIRETYFQNLTEKNL